MYCRKMVNMILMIAHKMWNILEGNFKNLFHIYPKFSRKRYAACRSCDQKLYIPLFGFICKKCGCIIESKITVKDEKCKLNKW